MSKKFHVIPTKLVAGQKFDTATNTLTLNQAGIFNITIKEYEDEYKALDVAFKKKSDSIGFQDKFNKPLKLGTEAYIDYQKKRSLAVKEMEELKNRRDNLYQKYANLQWCWQ